MHYIVTLEGPNGRLVELSADLAIQGELGQVCERARFEYKKLYPDAQDYEFTITFRKA